MNDDSDAEPGYAAYLLELHRELESLNHAGRLAQRGAGWHGEAEQTAKPLAGGLRDFNGETHG